METSILIARALGVVYLAFALGIILDWKRYRGVIDELLDSIGYLILAGFLAIVIGVLILSLHPGIPDDWTIVLPIVGWLAVLKGIFLISFPRSMVIYKSFLEWSSARWIILMVVLGIGLLFVYFGFKDLL